MTTLILIENVLGSGEVLRLTANVDAETVTRDLQPGERMRIALGRLQSVQVTEREAPARGWFGLGGPRRAAPTPSPLPQALERRRGCPGRRRVSP